VCSLLSVTQCASAILSSVACPLYNIFPHYLINGRTFEKCYWTQNVLWFTLQLLSEHSSSSRLPMWMIPKTPTQTVHLVTHLVYLPVLWWAKKVAEHYVPWVNVKYFTRSSFNLSCKREVSPTFLQFVISVLEVLFCYISTQLIKKKKKKEIGEFGSEFCMADFSAQGHVFY
jgi:hypothetical protein